MDLAGRDVQPGPYEFIPIEPLDLEIYTFFIQSIRDADQAEGGQLLQRWLQGMQDEWRETYNRIDSLRGLYNLEETSAAALSHVKWLVGLTSSLDFLTGGLTEEELRRLTSISARMWGRKGTEGGLQEVLETVSVREVRIDNWFKFRTLVNEWEPGFADVGGVDGWVTGDAGAETSVRPDAVTWTGEAVRLYANTYLSTLEVTGAGVTGDHREVRVHCVPSRVTAEGVWTLGVLGDVYAVVSGSMGQGTPSTNPDDYRIGVDPAEYCSDVRIADNGDLNRGLIENLVRVLRPSLERYFIRYVTFLDSFRRTPRWVTESGGAVYDQGVGTVTLHDDAEESAIRTDETDDLAWSDAVISAVLAMTSHAVGHWGEVRFFCQSGVEDFYALRLTPLGSTGATLSLDAVVSGVRSVLGSVSRHPWAEGTDFELRVNAEAGRIQGFLDGDLLLEVDDYAFSAGRLALACAAGQTMTVTYAELAQTPLESTRIGPAMSTR